MDNQPIANQFSSIDSFNTSSTQTISFDQPASNNGHIADNTVLTSILNTPSKKRSHITDDDNTLFNNSIPINNNKVFNDHQTDNTTRPNKRYTHINVDQLIDSSDDGLVADNANNSGIETFDHNFFELLNQFTQLDLPSTPVQHIEICPICNQQYSLDAFATHVYQCIKALDDVESRELIRLDAKLAAEIAEAEETLVLQGSLADIDQTENDQESKNNVESSDSSTDSSALADDENDSLNNIHDTIIQSHSNDINERMVDYNQPIENSNNELDYKHCKRRRRRLKRLQLATSNHTDTTSTMCPAGKSCNRTDATHFLLLQHPEVNCPLCNISFAVYEIEGHVIQCITSERPTRQLSSNTYSSRATTSTASPILVSPDTAVIDPITTVQLPPLQQTNTHNKNNTIGTSTIISRNRSSPSLPVHDDDDSSDERSNKFKSNKNQLNIYQASAMAHLVLQQRDKTPAQQDYSLSQLLSTFKSLGFNRENLTQILHTHGNASQSNNNNTPAAFIIDTSAIQQHTELNHNNSDASSQTQRNV